MTIAGIEAMNVFGGTAYMDVNELAAHRHLDHARFANLLMKEKAVALPNEDPITFGVNAAQPLVAALPAAEKARIELLITCSESGVDFGKSMSTYIHHYMGLNRNCRLFEIKQACYSGTAGLQMAVNFVMAQLSPGAKALVIATDIARFMLPDNYEEMVAKARESGASAEKALTHDWTFAEPSSGAGAVAVLVSATPHVFRIDAGANGYYGYEVMDACRPVPDGDAGNSDLSLLSYLDCCENAFREYCKRVSNASFRSTFQYLAFHTPFGGMVKGAHRTMMRKLVGAAPEQIEQDFQQRVAPGMRYCQRVGNIMGGTVLMSLASTIDHGDLEAPRRIGCFSYGSGCCSEFYSGVAHKDGQLRQQRLGIQAALDSRYRLSTQEYDSLLRSSRVVRFGTRNVTLEGDLVEIAQAASKGAPPRLYLRQIKDYHREYEWSQ